MVKQDEELEEELATEVGVGNLGKPLTAYSEGRLVQPTSRSIRSGLVKNLAKKYSLVLASSASGSRFRFRVPGPAPALLPIIARSLAVASLMTGKTLLTDSLNSLNVFGAAKRGGFENGS